MTVHIQRVVGSPVGALTLISDGSALTGLYFEGHRPAPQPARGPDGSGLVDATAAERILDAAALQLAEYFAGERTAFDLPLRLVGTAFQRSVWEQLRGIPYGEVITYGELARRIGKPNAFRAAGSANGRNPVSIIVPCHRVIAAGGKLGGYGGGLDRKTLLLQLENRERLF